MDHDPTSSPGASSRWLLKCAALMGILLLAAAIVFWAKPLLEKRRAQKIVERHFTWSQSEKMARIKPIEDRGQELVALDAETVWALSVIGTKFHDLSNRDKLRNVAALKSLPTLVSLNLNFCTGLTSVDALPASLRKLDLAGCKGLTRVAALPAGLQELNLYRCTGLTAVDALPAGLQRLTLTGCTGLTGVDALPDSLTRLGFMNCSRLTRIEKLPAGLTYIELAGCMALERVGTPPAGLKEVYMRNTPKLPEGVKAEIRALVKKNGGQVDG